MRGSWSIIDRPIPGTVGIAHTRWATHGAPTRDNAHPHATDEVALVHNGIIENFKPLREELIAEGREFESQTDTEVVAHLVSREIERGAEPKEAVAATLRRLHGAFSLAILCRQYPDMIIGARLWDKGKVPPLRYFGNRFANFWVAWAAGCSVSDSQSGFRLYPASLLRKVRVAHGPTARFAFESEILIEAGRAGVRSVAVPPWLTITEVLTKPVAMVLSETTARHAGSSAVIPTETPGAAAATAR